MSEIIKKHQFLIERNKAKSIGKSGMLNHLDKPIAEFFNEICKSALNGDGIIAIQWAISELDELECKNVIIDKEIEMPLIKGAKQGTKSFGKNIAEEIKSGKPKNQSVAIAYSLAKEGKSKKNKK